MATDFLLANPLLTEAIAYATECHAGQFRKGTSIPYIVHPLETLHILASMHADLPLLIAGVLHDTLEDTGATPEEIRERFGPDVLELVLSHTEDKSKSWDERKQHAIDSLNAAPMQQQMLVMADKVANLRSLYADYQQLGDALWARFHAPKEKQAWYYSMIQDALYEMQLFPTTKDVYREMVGLYKELFVSYYLDVTQRVLYQSCVDGSTYFLEKGKPQWNTTDNIIPFSANQISRKDAETLEDLWGEPFWAVHNLDLKDNLYELFSSPSEYRYMLLKNKALHFHSEDRGDSCIPMSGTTHYEFIYSLEEEATKYFLVQLRLQHGIDNPLADILKELFGSPSGHMAFQKYCTKLDLEYEFSAY